MVIAPYNAQVRRLRDALAAAGLGGIRVGIVLRGASSLVDSPVSNPLLAKTYLN